MELVAENFVLPVLTWSSRFKFLLLQDVIDPSAEQIDISETKSKSEGNILTRIFWYSKKFIKIEWLDFETFINMKNFRIMTLESWEMLEKTYGVRMGLGSA